MLGRDVMRVGEEAGHEMTGLARVELDICDREAVEAAVAEVRPGGPLVLLYSARANEFFRA